jgi:hypothetical protein
VWIIGDFDNLGARSQIEVGKQVGADRTQTGANRRLSRCPRAGPEDQDRREVGMCHDESHLSMIVTGQSADLVPQVVAIEKRSL